MRKDSVSTLKVAATYIGTIVGAGFATGQELLQFFTRFGIGGLGGLIVTTILFIAFGYIIMDLGRELNARSHLEIVRYSGGKFIGTFIDIIITIFLFGSVTAMIAGTGALFEQQLKLPSILGNLLMAVITALTVLTGIQGVINSISYVVPFLLTAVLGISVYSVIHFPSNLYAMPEMMGHSDLINHWLVAAILYVSYNTVISVGILGPLGNEAQNKKAIWTGAILGGLGLGLGSLMIYAALSGHIADIEKLEVPMIFIAGRISPLVQVIYAVVLIAEVYTTAVSSLYSFASRIVDTKKTARIGRTLVIGSTIAALLASQFGFSNLVKYIYPLEGYCGVALLIALVIKTFRKKEISCYSNQKQGKSLMMKNHR